MKSSISLMGTIFRDNIYINNSNNNNNCSLGSNLNENRNASLCIKKLSSQNDKDQRSLSNDKLNSIHNNLHKQVQIKQYYYKPLHRTMHILNIKLRKIKQYVFIKLINKPKNNSIQRNNKSNSENSQKLLSTYKSILQRKQSHKIVSQFKVRQNDNFKNNQNNQNANKKQNVEAGFEIFHQFIMVKQSKMQNHNKSKLIHLEKNNNVLTLQKSFYILKCKYNKNKAIKKILNFSEKRKIKYYDQFFMKFMKKIEQSLKLDFLIHQLSKIILKQSFKMLKVYQPTQYSSSVKSSNISFSYDDSHWQFKTQPNQITSRKQQSNIVQSQLYIQKKKKTTSNNANICSIPTSEQNSAVKVTNFDPMIESQSSEEIFQEKISNIIIDQTPRNKYGENIVNYTCQSFKISSKQKGKMGKSKSKILLHYSRNNQGKIKISKNLELPSIAKCLKNHQNNNIQEKIEFSQKRILFNQQLKIKIKNLNPEGLINLVSDINDSKFFLSQISRKFREKINKIMRAYSFEEDNHKTSIILQPSNQYENNCQQQQSLLFQKEHLNFRTQAYNQQNSNGLSTKYFSKQIYLEKNKTQQKRNNNFQKTQINQKKKNYDDNGYRQSFNDFDKKIRSSLSAKNINKGHAKQAQAQHSKSKFQQIDNMMKNYQKIKSKSNFGSHNQSINQSFGLKDLSKEHQQNQNKYVVNLNLKKCKNTNSLKDGQLSSATRFQKTSNNSLNQSIFYSDKKPSSKYSSYKSTKQNNNNIEVKLLALKKQKLMQAETQAQRLNSTTYSFNNNNYNSNFNGKKIEVQQQMENKKKKSIILKDQRKNSQSRKMLKDINLCKSKPKHNTSILKYATDQKLY